jgi:predicted DNA-binding protein with PD1-like motif
MKSKLLEEIDGLKVFALVLDTGDEVIETLTRFARERRIGTFSSWCAIGSESSGATSGETEISACS